MNKEVFEYHTNMEFPMSNSRLQNIADEFEVYLNEKYIDNIVDQIKRKIVSIAYSKCELTPRKRSQRVALGTSSLGMCGMYDTIMDKKLSIKIEGIQVDRNSLNRNEIVMSSMYLIYNIKPYIPEIISKIQSMFPEMKITVDPLETYILFDWS